MYNFNSNEARLDDLLNRIGYSLQLNKARREKMETAYKAVSEWIENDEGFFKDVDFEIYPHGSVSTGTTVKPLEKEEFDLDFVIHIRLDWNQHDPFTVYKELQRRLEEHEVYKKLVVPKNRVQRLDYAGDFHMDIMPGCQEVTWDVNRIKVPDRKRKNWVSSNPRGFSMWFEVKANSVKEFLLEKAFAMQELPQQEPYQLKKPLKRAVQLIKRYRDVYFKDDPNNSPSSIILTTLAGEYYKGEGTIYETIDNVVSEINQTVQQGLYGFKVFNPVNPNEEFTDKWRTQPELFHSFVKFAEDFKKTWDTIKREAGVDQSEEQLKSMFGERTFSKALNEQKEYFEKAFGNTPQTFIHTAKDTYEGLRNLAVKSKPFLKQ